MGFDIREETFEQAADEVAAVLNETREHPIHEKRSEWLYRNNPDGAAVLWTVRDTDTGQLAGFTVALPRRMLVEHQPRTCWNCADFSIRPKFRTLGVAIKLRRAAKMGVDEGRVDFLYANPNERMEVIHAKVGHQPVGRMIRHARVLRSATYLGDRLKSRAVGTLAGGIVDPLLGLSQRIRTPRATYHTRLLEATGFDERFDELFEQAAAGLPIVGVRDRRYLQWRYADNPIYESEVLVAEEGDRLRGYLVFRVEDGVGHIKDLFPPGDPHVARDLLAAAYRIGRRSGLISLSTSVLEGSPLSPALRENGFRPRSDGSRMFAYAADDRPWHDAVTRSDSWFMIEGDRDV